MEKKFIQNWTEKLENGELKKFPEMFINDAETKEVKLPEKTLVLGPELFGAYELMDTSNNTHYQAPDVTHAKYILYANRTKPETTVVPVDEKVIEDAVKAYEKHLDDTVRAIVDDYKNCFPMSKNQVEISNQIFVSLNLQRY